jgi:hypothetical protein
MLLQRLISLRSLIVVTAFACVTLAFLRVAAETSFHKPVHRPTTGLEEEALFSIWKVSEHQPVYADSFQIPYAISYFNWLFYTGYGLVGTLALKVLGLDSGWLPTVARFLTLFLTFACGLGFWMVAQEGRLWPEGWSGLQKVCVAAIAAFNPLFGFLIFTARPDVAALFCELAGLALTLRYLRTQRRLLLAAATIVLFCAWSFKQTSVLVVSGICLWFLLNRRFSEFRLVSVISGALYLTTFLIGGQNYFYAVVQSQANCGFHFLLGADNLLRACQKSFLLPLALLVWSAAALSRHPEWRKPTRSPISVIFVFSLVWCAVLSMKEGASAYYFVGPFMLAMLWLVGFVTTTGCLRESPILRRVVVAGLCLQLLGVGLACLGRARVDRSSVEQQRHQRLAQKLDPLPGPILVSERFDNLPWIQRKPPNFMYAYTYWFDRAAGKSYGQGGLGGLIRSHYFKTIVLRNSPEAPAQSSFDGQSLADYERLESDSGYDFYVLAKASVSRSDSNPL